MLLSQNLGMTLQAPGKCVCKITSVDEICVLVLKLLFVSFACDCACSVVVCSPSAKFTNTR